MLMLDQTPLTSTPTCGRNHRNGRAVWTETGGRFPPKSEGGFSRNMQANPRRIPERRFQRFLPGRKPPRSAVITAGDGPVRFPSINDVGDMSNHVLLPQTANRFFFSL